MSNTDVLILDFFNKLGMVSPNVDGEYTCDRDYFANLGLINEASTDVNDAEFKECDNTDFDDSDFRITLADYEFFKHAIMLSKFTRTFVKYIVPSATEAVLEKIVRVGYSCYVHTISAKNNKTGDKIYIDLVMYDGEYLNMDEFSAVTQKLSISGKNNGYTTNRMLLSIVPLNKKFCDGSVTANAPGNGIYRKNVCINLNGTKGPKKYIDLVNYLNSGVVPEDNTDLATLDKLTDAIRKSF